MIKPSTTNKLLVTLTLLSVTTGARFQRQAEVPQFQVEEATIATIQNAIKSGQTTCRVVVQAYIDRARAYNGVCTSLVTADGADVPPARGYVRAGAPLTFPTKTVGRSTIFPDLGPVPRPAARLRPDGADHIGPERHAPDGDARRHPQRRTTERA